MNSDQYEILLEEIRKLRGEVRAVRSRVMWIFALVAIGIFAVAFKLDWFMASFASVTLTAAFAGLIWLISIAWNLHRANRKARRLKTPARVIFTPQSSPKP
jgi:hypothetical protein